MNSRLWVLLLSLLLVACGSTEQRPVDAAAHQSCSDPRPQVCTMDYSPVCATLVSQQRKQYSNACGACSDPAVISYVAGACPAAAP